MSKIEVVGPRDLLLSVLGTVRQSGVLQIDADLKESIEPGVEAALRPQTLDGRVLAERLFLEDLKLNIDRLLELLPKVPTRESYLSPERAVNAIASFTKDGLVAEADAPKDDAAGDDRRRYYRITPLGKRVVKAEAERLAGLATLARDRKLI